ncbi:chain length determinant protein [Actinacidiphila acididurans]|uniref:Chain length determinant protein n=1 Tax=Actinacidiphila acididurans TaxID=2784346 RepID=A0ABS2TJL2_9ACTN|nr:chain length determinant protein [Actinacidiphila acididurans]MBM9503524.1 chain length determinant protein [Actinacidiphila acididurans]
MDLAEIFRVMRRRWYVVLPGLLLTAALLAGAYLRLPITYQSQSTVLLLNSQKATVAFDGNPFLSTQTSLTGMADSLARNLNSDDSLADLRAQGATTTVVAKIADNALGPLVWLTASGSDKAAVLHSDRLMTAYAAKRLEQFQIQQGVASRAMIRMTTIVPPQTPVAKTKTRTEYLVLAAVMGIVITLVATFYVEARRRTPAGRGSGPDRKAAHAAGGPGAVPGEAAATVPSQPSGPGGDPDGAAADAGGEPDPSGAGARSAPRWSAPGAAEQPSGDGAAGTEATGPQAHRFV